ncbi:pentapeptide repeat-containing protein [Funiculus sociatus]
MGEELKAIAYQKERLTIVREIQDRQSEMQTLLNLGAVYYSLEEYSQAKECFQECRAIALQLQDSRTEGLALKNLRLVSDALLDSQAANDYQQQHSSLVRKLWQAEALDFLAHAKMLGINPSEDFAKADLSGINLRSADLSNADLNHTNLSDADLTFADLSRANLESANLAGACLCNANLRDADLRGANLSRADLRTKMPRANLSGANLESANLYSAYLPNAKLVAADLSGATLSDADLSGANLSRANLQNADLKRTNLSGANVENARLIGALGLSEAMKLELKQRGAIFDDS